jgi:hypothetical protein
VSGNLADKAIKLFYFGIGANPWIEGRSIRQGKHSDRYSDKEVRQRFEAALSGSRLAIRTPVKLHAENSFHLFAGIG